MHTLSTHRRDELLFGRAEQLRVAGHRPGVEENCDIHHPGLVGLHQPETKTVAIIGEGL
jgi:hypothetical protein